MAQDQALTRGRTRGPRFWIWLVAIVIALIFLYFYKPFGDYLSAAIPNIRFDNVLFWFASLVGVIAYIIAHWQSFKANIYRTTAEQDVEGLVYDTLQIAILVAIIFTAGATIQAVEMIGQHLMSDAPNPEVSFGQRLLSIIVLLILVVLFYLLHHLVRLIRIGWRPRRPVPRSAGPGAR